MQTQRTVDGAPTPSRQIRRSSGCQWCRSARRVERPRVAPATVAPRRVGARTTSRGASSNTSKDHPQSTTGDIAKGLNADRGTIAAGLSHIVRASDATKGQAAD